MGWLGWLASESQEPPLCLRSVGISSTHHYTWLFFFHVGSGDLTQIPVLSHVPQPTSGILAY